MLCEILILFVYFAKSPKNNRKRVNISTKIWYFWTFRSVALILNPPEFNVMGNLCGIIGQKFRSLRSNYKLACTSCNWK